MRFWRVEIVPNDKQRSFCVCGEGIRVSSVVVSHCPINIYRVLYCRRNSSVLHFCFLRMDFPDYSASLEAALGLRTAIPIVLPVGIVLRGGVSQELDAGLETCTRWNGLLPFVSDVML